MCLIPSNDVHVNPGPNNSNKVFSFSNWNCNSLVKNKFNRVNLLKVQASTYNYDVEIPETLIDGYNFVPLNHPSGNRRGGVAIVYTENFPPKIRKDLSFNECLVNEVLIGKRKVLYSVCYRSPNMKPNTPEFEFFS